MLRSREVFTHDESIDEFLNLFLEEATYKLNTGKKEEDSRQIIIRYLARDYHYGLKLVK
jgi:3-phenylpropionate/cinnamic acid dioxygenase small subunit